MKTVVSTDAFVVRPLQFPGGSIGTLAVHGTANDIAVAGGEPLAMLATFVLEAGLPGSVLEREVARDGGRRATPPESASSEVIPKWSNMGKPMACM